MDFEEMRKALMKRDAGYTVECDWELLGRLLKDHDRLRAELDEVKAEGRQEVANLVSSYRTAARRDAETIEALRRTLDSVRADRDASDAEIRRRKKAAPTCLPQA